jgi:hypothetical protein
MRSIITNMTAQEPIEKFWQKTDSQLFWGEEANGEHVVQMYDSDESLLTLLATFVVGGIRSGNAVVVIATKPHILEIRERLRKAGFDPFSLKLKDQFIPLDAETMIAKFFVNEWPDEILFNYHLSRILKRARTYNRQVRAFGEMVALLYQQGLVAQTIQLENLWNKFCRTNSLSLFCAYPDRLLNDVDLNLVCCEHTKQVAAAALDSNDILFRPLQQQRSFKP